MKSAAINRSLENTPQATVHRLRQRAALARCTKQRRTSAATVRRSSAERCRTKNAVVTRTKPTTTKNRFVACTRKTTSSVSTPPFPKARKRSMLEIPLPANAAVTTRWTRPNRSAVLIVRTTHTTYPVGCMIIWVAAGDSRST